MAWGGLTIVIFCVPYQWLAGLSLWQRLGWESAPSIGLTRAYWLLIHGDPVAAWQRNGLIYAVCAVGACMLAHDTIILLKNRQKIADSLH